MRRFLILPFLLVGLASATTLEVVQVFQPLSLHETDTDYEFEGEAIQARVLSSPFVLTGAMPENLIAAIAKPHRMAGAENYEVKESNLLALYRVGLEAGLTDDGVLLVTFDLSEMKAPEEVELPIRMVLRLAIVAVKKSLSEYHHDEDEPLNVSIEIAGTTAKNATLKDLTTDFSITD